MRDIDIRGALHANPTALHQADPTTRIFDELALCQGSARVDIAVVNGELHGFEIKSAHDTLDRLPHQAEVYSRVFDRVTLVVSSQHCEKARTVIPEWWGISEALETDDGITINENRPSQRNPAVDPCSVVQLLWREEALAALRTRGLSKGVESKPRKAVWAKLVEELSVEEIGEIVRSQLKARYGWRLKSDVQLP